MSQEINLDSLASKIETALSYLGLGWSVIPVGIDKRPLIEWKKYQSEFATKEEVENWFFKNPNANIGIVTGTISKLTVIDIEKGGDPELFPETVKSQTGGGGWHYYYRSPDSIVRNAVRTKDLVDIRGEGGYVLAPPSTHLSGGAYSWIVSPWTTNLAEFPSTLFQGDEKAEPKKDWSDLLTGIVGQGSRNQTTTQIVGLVLKTLPEGLWEPLGWGYIRSWNDDHNQPPLAERELRGIWESIKRRETISRGNPITIPVPQPPEVPLEFDFEGWKEVIVANFPELVRPAEIGVSIFAQFLIKDITNPFACIYVGPPSAGKTITLNFFSDLKDLVYSTDKFSPSSFVSHAANVSREKLASVDLLPRIKNKTMLIRDMTTIFSQQEDKLKEGLGLLTRVLDGEGLEIDSGVHGKRGYTEAHLFMLLGATTEASLSDRIWNILGSLGSRMFFYRIPGVSKSDDELASQLEDNAVKRKEILCRDATAAFVQTLFKQWPERIEWDKSNSRERTIKTKIARSAKLLARLRGVVSFETYQFNDEKETHCLAQSIEKPDRINQLLYNLARGHAIVQGRVEIDGSDLIFINDLVLQSAPKERVEFYLCLNSEEEGVTTDQVESMMKVSKPKALKLMNSLHALGLCDIELEPTQIGRPSMKIALKPEFKSVFE